MRNHRHAEFSIALRIGPRVLKGTHVFQKKGRRARSSARRSTLGICQDREATSEDGYSPDSVQYIPMNEAFCFSSGAVMVTSQVLGSEVEGV